LSPAPILPKDRDHENVNGTLGEVDAAMLRMTQQNNPFAGS
jgi:hypothetical protein